MHTNFLRSLFSAMGKRCAIRASHLPPLHNPFPNTGSPHHSSNETYRFIHQALNTSIRCPLPSYLEPNGATKEKGRP